MGSAKPTICGPVSEVNVFRSNDSFLAFVIELRIGSQTRVAEAPTKVDLESLAVTTNFGGPYRKRH